MPCLTLAFLTMVFIAAGHLAQVVQQTMNVSRERDQLIGSLEQRHLEAKRRHGPCPGSRQDAYTGIELGQP